MWVEANSGSGGGGGSETETTLWTNPRPSSGFNEDNVYLSVFYTDYKKIGFYYKNYANTDNEYVTYYDKEEIDKWYSNTGKYGLGSIAARYNNKNYTRYISVSYTSNGSVFTISQCYQHASSSSAASAVLPTKITGIN